MLSNCFSEFLSLISTGLIVLKESFIILQLRLVLRVTLLVVSAKLMQIRVPGALITIYLPNQQILASQKQLVALLGQLKTLTLQSADNAVNSARFVLLTILAQLVSSTML